MSEFKGRLEFHIRAAACQIAVWVNPHPTWAEASSRRRAALAVVRRGLVSGQPAHGPGLALRIIPHAAQPALLRRVIVIFIADLITSGGEICVR